MAEATVLFFPYFKHIMHCWVRPAVRPAQHSASVVAIEKAIYGSTRASKLSHPFVLLDPCVFLLVSVYMLVGHKCVQFLFNVLTCPQACPVVPGSRSSPPAFTAAFLASVLNPSACFSQCPCLGYWMTTDTAGSTPGISMLLKKPSQIPLQPSPPLPEEATAQEVRLL